MSPSNGEDPLSLHGHLHYSKFQDLDGSQLNSSRSSQQVLFWGIEKMDIMLQILHSITSSQADNDHSDLLVSPLI